MEITISRDRNMIKKKPKTFLKCKYFTIKIQRVWNVKTVAIPAIMRTTGTIPEPFRKHLNNISEKHRQLKKTVTLCTGHIFRKVPDKKCA
jgi:hypothetical protein